MWTYIARRLLLMIVTVFGITLVTYGVMRLTPGDPSSVLTDATKSTGAPITKEDLERNRAYFNLDKPAFFNFSPLDRRKQMVRRMEDFDADRDETRKSAKTKLKTIGAAGLEPAMEMLAQALADEKAAPWETRKVPLDVAHTGKPRAALSAHLLKALPLLAHALAKKPAVTLDAAGWQAWWEANRAELTHAKASAAVTAYVQGSGSIADGVASLGNNYHTLATEALIDALNSSDTARMDRVMRPLAVINGKPFWVLEEGVTPTSEKGKKDLARLYERWTNWYGRNGAKLVDLSLGRRAIRVVSETQYGTWLYRLSKFDFGDSFKFNKPVIVLLKPRIYITMQLSLLSILLAYLVAIPLGIFSAARPYSRADRASTVVLFILYSLPSFWVGNLMIAYFTGGSYFPFNMPYRSAHLHELTMFSGEWLREMAMPLMCLTYASFAYISRQMRGGMMEVIRADFIRTARAKGLSENVVILKHALRNSLIPVLTIMASILPRLIGGSIIIEQIFSIEGMGKLAFESAFNRDYPVVMAIAFFSGILTMIGVLISDLSYALVDPRISYE